MIDDKLRTYIILLVLAALTYAILRFNAIGDTLVTFLFLIASYRLIFTQERKFYSEEEVYEEPENYVKQNVRLNLYSFRIVFAIVGFSLVYYLWSFVLGWKAGIILLIAWVAITAIYYYVRKQGSTRLELALKQQYVASRMQNQTQNNQLVRDIVEFIHNRKNDTNLNIREKISEKYPNTPESIIDSIIRLSIEFDEAFKAEYERIPTTNT